MRVQRFAQVGVAGILGVSLSALGLSPTGPGHVGAGVNSTYTRTTRTVGTLVAGLQTESRVCAIAKVGRISCGALVMVNKNGRPAASTSPRGFDAADLEKAYGIGGFTAPAGATVAVVDAYSDPAALSDLNTYRAASGLPAMSATCDVQPCFSQVSQTGSTSLPPRNASWAQEISLDLQMATAACPGCNLLLVDAKAADTADLAAGVSYAKALTDVVAVSNSYGGSEDSSLKAYSSIYTPARSGQWIVASAGDDGFGAQFPADFASVVAVGGTSLTLKSDGSYRSETAWDGGGSGCSAYVKAAFNSKACSGKRAITDVSADADPDTGVAIYDSVAYQGVKGWLTMGGTSAAAPFIAGVHALADSTSTSAAGLFGPNAAVRDVTSGSNGKCSVKIMCTAGKGYDGPTGVGSPDGSGGDLTGF